MAFAQKNNYSVDDYKGDYQDITALYDYADELICSVNNFKVKAPQEQLDLVEPLVNEITDVTDILTEEFILVAESKKPRSTSKFSKKNIESALRRAFVAINDYQEISIQLAKESGGKVINIADKIVEKIQKQLDKVVVIFLELVSISLQSIIGKTEIDALRVRNSQIAIMMHQLSLPQH
jgi:hypothetical protein